MWYNMLIFTIPEFLCWVLFSLLDRGCSKAFFFFSNGVLYVGNTSSWLSGLLGILIKVLALSCAASLCRNC